MSDKKLTDTEIIKALECCILGDCQGCFYGDTDQRRCKDDLMQNALDLINRLTDQLNSAINGQETLQGYVAKQDKEIERLKANLNVELDNFASEYDSKIKSEAVKEFAERLKKDIFNTEYHIDRYYRRTIDKLTKEMVGENNATT